MGRAFVCVSVCVIVFVSVHVCVSAPPHFLFIVQVGNKRFCEFGYKRVADRPTDRPIDALIEDARTYLKTVPETPKNE